MKKLKKKEASKLLVLMSKNVFLLMASFFQSTSLSGFGAPPQLRLTCGTTAPNKALIFSPFHHQSITSGSICSYQVLLRVINSRFDSTSTTENSKKKKKKKMEQSSFDPAKLRADFIQLLRCRRSAEGLNYHFYSSLNFLLKFKFLLLKLRVLILNLKNGEWVICYD